ncbi:MAG: ferritin [Proteobacteria bacterium]|nr:ferritin [Pseudomonadota bacterium]
MLKDEIVNAINEQINREMYSAFLYMSMSAYSSSIGLKGFANWFMVQYHEEMVHAMKFYEYIQRQGAQVRLKALKEPPVEFKSPMDMFTQTLSHEQFITRSINDLMELAIKHKDHASQIFLQWYVNEQVEEEENDNDIILQLKLINNDPHALLMLDRELAARMMTVPTDFSKGVEAAMSATKAP